jgi:hypothetical protein
MSFVSCLVTLILTMALIGCEAPSGAQLDVSDQQLLEVPADNLQKADNPFAGTWKMTSAVVGDDELLLNDISVLYTHWNNGDYSVAVSDDDGHLLCKSPQTSCAWTGTYTYTASSITFDEVGGPEPGEDSMGYAFCGGRLILADVGVRLTFVRARHDCYVKDCS